MHKYIILFFSVLTILCSCSSDSAPDGILKKSEMVGVLTDMHIADAALISISQMPDTLYKYGYPRYAAVFKKHNTDSAEFRRSFKYYTLKPAVFIDIYDKVLKNLQVKSDSLTKLLTIQNKKTHVTPAATGGRVGSPGLPGSHPTPPTPVRPGMMLNRNQPEVIRFHSKRDSAIREQLKKQNALSKK